MNSAEKQVVLHCLKSMIDEEVCEECPLYGITGTDHCEKDCVRLAINALSSSEKPKVGKWIYDKKEDSYKCSLCGYPCHKDNLGAIPTKYCANCGSKIIDN